MTSPLERLQPIFKDVFDDSSLRIERSSSANTVEGWDSLAHVNLVAAVEKEFGVRFALGELAELKCVGDMVDLIENKLARR